MLSKLKSATIFDSDMKLSTETAGILGISTDQRDAVNLLIDQSLAQLEAVQEREAKIFPHTDSNGATIIIPKLSQSSEMLEAFKTHLREIIPNNTASLLEGLGQDQLREHSGLFGTEPILMEVSSETNSAGQQSYRVRTSYGLDNDAPVPLTPSGHVAEITGEGGREFSFRTLPKRLAKFIELK